MSMNRRTADSSLFGAHIQCDVGLALVLRVVVEACLVLWRGKTDLAGNSPLLTRQELPAKQTRNVTVDVTENNREGVNEGTLVGPAASGEKCPALHQEGTDCAATPKR
jgi:hypothetical protein